MIWVYPTAVPHVTSHFNLVRRHPVTGVVQPHWGTDYRAYTGTPIRAAAAGRVVRSLFGTVPGNYVRIDHGDGVWTGYSHLSRRDVAVGDRVGAGQVIGLAGDTGSATAAHLHFEVFDGARNVDPVPWLAARAAAFTVGSGTGAPGVPNVPGLIPPAPLEEDDMPLNDVDKAWITGEVHRLLLEVLRAPEFELQRAKRTEQVEAIVAPVLTAASEAARLARRARDLITHRVPDPDA